MKDIFFVLLVAGLIFAIGCSKKEEVKLTTSGKNAFAIDMGQGWEVQALTELHGFKQTEKEGKFIASVFYSIDVIEVDKKESEKINGINLEAEFNLDESYPAGNYKVIFNIKDLLSNITLKDTAELKLER